MSFPISPANGDITVINGTYYSYNSTYNSWTKAPSPISYGLDLDDLSYQSDGTKNTYTLTYNQAPLAVNSAFNLTVTVNGLLQPAFDYSYDKVWLSRALTASKGYTVDYDGKLKFADATPPGSEILVRTTSASPAANTKVYPFKALDVMTGY